MKKDNTNLPQELKKTSIGGQALIEGLMMIGPERKAMANLMLNGEIVVRDLGPNDTRSTMNIPFLRGAVRIFTQMAVGTKALLLSADLQEEAEAAEAAAKDNEASGSTAPNSGDETTEALPVKDESVPIATTISELQPKEKKLDWLVIFSLLLGLGMGVGLFILLPNALTSGLIALTGVPRHGFSNTVIYNLIEGVLRITILIFYMWLSSKQKDIKRVWMFHGAEHKTIACYESGMELTVDNVRPFSRFHPRCGTSFILILVFISALIFALVGWYGVWLNLLIRLALIPLVAGIAYEILRFSGKHNDTLVGKILAKPGLLLQRLTTKEPDDTMLAVAIQAMNAVIPEDKTADNWA